MEPDPRAKNVSKVLNRYGTKRVPFVRFVFQPPQSPDTNVLDLGIFNALSGAVSKINMNNGVSDIDALVKSSQEAFDQLDEETLKSVFLTKKLILREIIRSRGNNDFKLPHKAKSTVKSKESKKSSKLGVVSVFQNPATIFSGHSIQYTIYNTIHNT